MHDEGFSFLTSGDDRPDDRAAEADRRFGAKWREAGAWIVALALRLRGSLTIRSGPQGHARNRALAGFPWGAGASQPRRRTASPMNLLARVVDVTR